jgi:transcriptional regulator with XRE-family HTH domain
MTFGERLRELRKEKRMTQKELAEKAEIDFTYLSKIETGVMSPPREKTILALAKALEVEGAALDELFGLAKKIPSDLSNKVSPETIKMLRSFQGDANKPGDWPKTIEGKNNK